MKRLLLAISVLLTALQLQSAESERRLLYVATPGIRNYLEYGGHGLLVFDIDHGHKFVKRIKTSGLDSEGKPLNVKGVCASAENKRIYITTTRTMTCLDLVTEKIVWEKALPGGCDRMSISADGKIIYVPSFEGPHWNVVDAMSGERIAKITPNSGAHNTVYGADGSHVYLAGLHSPWLTIAETKTHTSNTCVGPFSAPVRPFTVNTAQTRAFCCVNELLGFEVGDITTGKVLHRVEVEGFKKANPKRHGCPSHGVGLTPDESEIWVCDSVNRRMHIFDNSSPPKQKMSVEVRDEPGWITFTIKGDLAYPSSGDVIDTATKKIIARLTDETDAAVQSEKLLEIDFRGDRPVRAGDQFGIGRKSAALSRK
jgi:DNA-binding beta-propeller fold protein YncE